MFGWFRRSGKSNRSSETPRGPLSAAPTLQSVTFDTNGLEYQRDEQGRRIWFTSKRDAAVNLFVFNKPPDLPGALQTIAQLRDFYLSLSPGTPATLVEIGLEELNGCKAVRLIIKGPQSPHGMTYYGSFTIPFRDFSFVLKVECPEQGPTGVREAVLLDKLMAAGKITLKDGPKLSGEWNPDDVQYDAEFPSHPVSRVRRMLRGIAQSCVLDPSIRSQPRFPLP